MEFKKYLHLEKFGNTEVDGIELGRCYIFPKIDGTNASIWMNDEGCLCAGSRNRELSFESDNAGFYAWVQENKDLFIPFFNAYPYTILYGEWLVPHTIKAYDDFAWKQFYTFDVWSINEFISYDTYKISLDKYGIEYIPPMCVIHNPTKENLMVELENNTYLIPEGKCVGEGIVIKNYSWKNKYGRTTWAKIVRNDFKTQHSKVQYTEKEVKEQIEVKIVNKFIDEHLVHKVYNKILNETGEWSSKYISRLLQTVYYDLVREEIWEICKTFKNPVIDFKRLSQFCNLRVKEVMPELF